VKTEALTSLLSDVSPVAPTLIVVPTQGYANLLRFGPKERNGHRVRFWWPEQGMQAVLGREYRLVMVTEAAIARSIKFHGAHYTQDWQARLRSLVKRWGEQGLYVEGL